MSEWFAIETAPKDGTWILVPYTYYGEPHLAAIHWKPDFEYDVYLSTAETTVFRGAWTDGVCVDPEIGQYREFHPELWTDIPSLPGNGV